LRWKWTISKADDVRCSNREKTPTLRLVIFVIEATRGLRLQGDECRIEPLIF